ncbi:MAG: HAMP domain-containing histidine kinase [Planctomycetes bacterium]|nr:HAMP domain-containing histidine kinase [Planctomycetota bacterium]
MAPSKLPSEQRLANRLAINASWLMRLRWVAVVGQLLTIGVAAIVFDVKLRLAPLLSIVTFTGATNVIFTVWLSWEQRHGKKALRGGTGQLLLFAVMALDVLLLTGLLYFAGGLKNPFTMFYFVNLSLSAVILPARWGWTLTAIAVICIAALFVGHVPLPELEQVDHASLLSRPLQQQGLLVALAGCSVVVIYFVTRVTRELRLRERQLRNAEQQRARSEHLEALGTLAAGAGHELATPLSTIAVVAKELTLHLEGVTVPDSVKEDVSLIRSEVDHCRSILDRMSIDLKDAGQEEVSRVTVTQLVEEVLEGITHRQRVSVLLDKSVENRELSVPLHSVAQAIRGVVQNALDAAPGEEPVDIAVAVVEQKLRTTVRDHGAGMAPDVLERAGQPFFTTKSPGEGMGLGLFLTRSVLERLGGTLELSSGQGRGVTAVMELPLD